MKIIFILFLLVFSSCSTFSPSENYEDIKARKDARFNDSVKAGYKVE